MRGSGPPWQYDQRCLAAVQIPDDVVTTSRARSSHPSFGHLRLLSIQRVVTGSEAAAPWSTSTGRSTLQILVAYGHRG